MIGYPISHFVTSSSPSHHYTVTKHPLIPSLSVFPAIITLPWPGTAPKTTHHGSHQSKPIPPTTSPGNTYHTIAPNNSLFKPPHIPCPSLLKHHFPHTPLQYTRHALSETHIQTSFFRTEIPHITHHTCEPSSLTPFFMNNILFFTSKVPHITHQRNEPLSPATAKSHTPAIHNLPLHLPCPQANPHPCQNHIDLTITIPQHCQLRHPTNKINTTTSMQTFHATPKSLAQPGRCSHKIAQVHQWGGQPQTL